MKRAALGLSALVAAVLLLVAPPALAHTELVSTTPSDGAALDALPTEVSLTFSEELLPETVKVSVADGDGNVVRIAAPTVDGAEVSFPWPGWPGTPTSDQWSVNYRVVSQDGHPVSGTLAFTAPPAVIAAPPGSASASVAASAAASAPPAASAAPSTPAESSTAASASAAPVTEEAGTSTGPSLAPILMIVAGLAAGIGIGLAFVARRRRTPSA